jgi:Integrase core domain
VTGGPTNLSWCTQIARNLSQAQEDRSEPIRFLVHDRDKRFAAPFDEVFEAGGVEILRTPWRAPKANADAERWIRTVRAECLDRVMVLGARHLERVLSTYVKHYNRAERDQAPRSPRRTYPRVLPEGCLSQTDGGSAGRRDRDIGAFPHKPEDRSTSARSAASVSIHGRADDRPIDDNPTASVATDLRVAPFSRANEGIPYHVRHICSRRE